MYWYGLTVESRELLYLEPREAPLARQTPYPFIPFLTEKVTPFVFLVLPNGTPFTYVVYNTAIFLTDVKCTHFLL